MKAQVKTKSQKNSKEIDASKPTVVLDKTQIVVEAPKQEKQLVKPVEDASFATTLWNKIKDQKIDMFALPNQKVSQYAQPADLDPSKLFLTYKVSAFVPAIEAVLGNGYKLEISGGYLIISKE